MKYLDILVTHLWLQDEIFNIELNNYTKNVQNTFRDLDVSIIYSLQNKKNTKAISKMKLTISTNTASTDCNIRYDGKNVSVY